MVQCALVMALKWIYLSLAMFLGGNMKETTYLSTIIGIINICWTPTVCELMQSPSLTILVDEIWHAENEVMDQFNRLCAQWERERVRAGQVREVILKKPSWTLKNRWERISSFHSFIYSFNHVPNSFNNCLLSTCMPISVLDNVGIQNWKGPCLVAVYNPNK